MATFDDVRRLGRRLPEVEEGTSYGTPALKVGGRRSADCGGLASTTARACTTPGPAMLVRLADVDLDLRFHRRRDATPSSTTDV